MDDFYAARSRIIPPLPWPIFAPPFSNGVFARIMVGLATERAEHKTIMIDATYLKAHRTASSLRVKKGGANARSGEPKAA